MEQAASREFERAADEMEKIAMELVPVATGRLKMNTKVEREIAGIRSRIILWARTPYAKSVEEGSVPHVTGSPRVREWAALKGIPAAWVYKSIAEKGTPAQPFIGPAAEVGREALLDGLARLPGIVP
jgi:hypothetical protein